MQKFSSFVILAEMRTGSNFLEMNLNRLAGFTCYGEAFNPFLLGNHKNDTLLGMTLAERNENPLALLDKMRGHTEGLSGFRYFHDHDPRVLDAVLDDSTCAKIILTRNPVESFVSWKIAQETNQWRLMNTRRHTATRPVFDGAEFRAHLDLLQGFQVLVLNRLQTTGQTAFYLDYEDIMNLDVLNGIARFLGLTARLSSIDTTLKKQNPEAVEDKVSNPAEMAAALARLDRFNLTRTPNFEPRRNAAVPHYIASTVAPLLFMPIAGAAVAEVSAWLAGFGPLEQDFDRKSLRKWKAAHPMHLSFTVLRHPLARAHAMFCDFLTHNTQPELRPYLAKFHFQPLPAPGEAFETDAAFRAAFLVFLNFLRRNVSGQTGLKVLSQFASQTAIVQGFSAFFPPHLLLKEDQLETGLARIAEDFGRPSPAIPALAQCGYVPLPQIYGPDLEQAARAAYDRDYTSFGFGDWRA